MGWCYGRNRRGRNMHPAARSWYPATSCPCAYRPSTPTNPLPATRTVQTVLVDANLSVEGEAATDEVKVRVGKVNGASVVALNPGLVRFPLVRNRPIGAPRARGDLDDAKWRDLSERIERAMRARRREAAREREEVAEQAFRGRDTLATGGRVPRIDGLLAVLRRPTRHRRKCRRTRWGARSDALPRTKRLGARAASTSLGFALRSSRRLTGQ